MRYVIDRLKEPGTLRSLAVVVFGLLGVTPDDEMLNGVLWVATIALGLISAFMPEKKAETVQAEAVKAQATVEAVATAAQTAQAAAATIVEARSLIERVKDIVSPPPPAKGVL